MDRIGEIVCGWMHRATRDAEIARILLREGYAGESTFHSQQAVEKALKALLVARNTMPPKTHNIRRLIDLVGTYGVKPPLGEEEPELLTGFSVASRYPDFEDEPGEDEAMMALEAALRVVEWARKILVEWGIQC